MKKIISIRPDANGSRLLGLISAFYVAEKLNAKPCFYWRDGIDGLDAKHGLEKDKFTFDGKEILSVHTDKKEDIFDKDFLDEFHVEKPDENSILFWEFSKYKTLAQISQVLKNNTDNIKYIEVKFFGFVKEDDYPKKACEIFTKKIKFSKQMQEVINNASDLAKSLGEFSALHIRSGDVVYSFNSTRKTSTSNYHATSAHFAIELINSTSGKIVLFGDDVSTIRQIKDYINDDRILVAQDLKEKMENEKGWHLDTATKSFLFDVIFMSKAKEIFGSGSSVLLLSAQVGEKNIISTHTFLRTKEHYYNIKKNLEKIHLHKDQQAFSYLQTFLLADKLNIDISFQEYCLKKALELDFENDKYRLYLVYHYLKHHSIKKADEYMGEILKERKDEFLKTILLVIEGNYTYSHRELRMFFYYNEDKYKNLAVVKKAILDDGILFKQLSFKNKFHTFLKRVFCNTALSKYILKI